MRSLEDTLRGLECCFQYKCCFGCPYHKEQIKSSGDCIKAMGTDALLHLTRLKGLADLLKKMEDDLK